MRVITRPHSAGEVPLAAFLAGQLTRILDSPLDAASRESADRDLDDIRLFIQSYESSLEQERRSWLMPTRNESS